MEEVQFVIQGEEVTKAPEPENDWAESEWFQVWLRLARRDYHGRVPGKKDFRDSARTK